VIDSSYFCRGIKYNRLSCWLIHASFWKGLFLSVYSSVLFSFSHLSLQAYCFSATFSLFFNALQCLVVNRALEHVTGRKFIPVGLFILHKHFKAHPLRQRRDGHLAGLATILAAMVSWCQNITTTGKEFTQIKNTHTFRALEVTCMSLYYM